MRISFSNLEELVNSGSGVVDMALCTHEDITLIVDLVSDIVGVGTFSKTVEGDYQFYIDLLAKDGDSLATLSFEELTPRRAIDKFQIFMDGFSLGLEVR